MPPVISRRSAALPTLVSLSKLFHLVPAALSNRHTKRGVEWAVTAASTLAEEEGGGEEEPGPERMFKLILSVGLVLLGGVFAGLTLALMGSDDLNLRVLAASSDDPRERSDATKVLRLLGRGRHWVLVVLLLGNVIVNESLPIFLDDVLGGGLAAVVASTVMIVIFGEVIPQAVCVRYGLAIGGYCAPMVHALMILFAPIAWPIAKLLDWALGHDAGHTYKKAELKSFLQFHREGEEPLRDDEIIILNGVLSLNDRHVKEIMTPIDDCLVLPADKVLDHDAVDHILISGFSRLPVHEPGQPDNFIGMLLVKRLITYNPDDNKQVSSFPLLPLPEATPDLNCFQALDYFQTGRAHLLLISETPGRRGGALGILSLEDLIEEIIGEEIIDETDRYQDNHSKRKAQRKATREIMLGIIERQRVINAFSRRPSGEANSTSRTQSPHPTTRVPPPEGILVQLAGGTGAFSAEPTPIEAAVTADLGSTPRAVVIPPAPQTQAAEVVVTSPNGEQNVIVETAVPQPGSTQLVGADAAAAVDDTSATDPGAASDSTATPGSNTTTSADDDKDSSATPEPEPETSTAAATTTKPKQNGKRRKGKKNKGDTEVATALEPFPTAAAFERVSHAFLQRYAGRHARGPGAERTNVGWEWRIKSSMWRGEQGYLFRRDTKWSAQSATSADDQIDDVAQAMRDEAAAAAAAAEVEDCDHDAAALAPSAGPRSRVEREYSVVWSPTYRVPMLCVRAWDEHGVPLGLDEIVTHVLRAGGAGAAAAARAHSGGGGGLERTDALMLPGAPFPLLQQTEHPVTGDVVWSVHPCEVRGAVGEVVATEDEEEEDDDDDDDGQVGGEQLRWLEAWFMLSNSVVDLEA